MWKRAASTGFARNKRKHAFRARPAHHIVNVEIRAFQSTRALSIGLWRSELELGKKMQDARSNIQQDDKINGDLAFGRPAGFGARVRWFWNKVCSSRRVQMRQRKLAAIVSNVRKSKALFVTDVISAMLSLLFAYLLRYGIDTVYLRPDLMQTLAIAAPQYLLVCAVVFPLVGLYSRHWRYGSLADLWAIFRAVVVTSLVLVSILFLRHACRIFRAASSSLKVFCLRRSCRHRV